MFSCSFCWLGCGASKESGAWTLAWLVTAYFEISLFASLKCMLCFNSMRGDCWLFDCQWDFLFSFKSKSVRFCLHLHFHMKILWPLVSSYDVSNANMPRSFCDCLLHNTWLGFLLFHPYLFFLKFVCLVIANLYIQWIFGLYVPFLIYLDLQLMNLLHSICCMPFCYLKTIA